MLGKGHKLKNTINNWKLALERGGGWGGCYPETGFQDLCEGLLGGEEGIILVVK